MSTQSVHIADLPTPKYGHVSPHRPLPPQPMRKVHWGAFIGIIACSTFLNLFQLQQNGYGNLYYATAVKSMLLNWHNFFFVSFDPGGFVSVDKPPVDLWLQAASAKLFGFSGISLFLPQALAGVLAVVCLFHLVRRSLGPAAGLLSALIMAITPMVVVISRDNNLDMLLILVLLLATWAVIGATETGKIHRLLFGAVLIGIGFNIKMFEAYLVVPALGLLYLLAAPGKWRWRILHLVFALGVLLLVSLSWITVVDLTPPAQRPYVGSSQTNSEWELALGYNGLNRLFHPSSGSKTQPGQTLRQPLPQPLSLLSLLSTTAQEQETQALPVGNGNNSSPGLLRLFTQPISSQIAWLLPLALLGLLLLPWQQRWRRPFTKSQQALLLWGTWLITALVVLSIAVHFLTYYTTMLAPAISALSGIGLTRFWLDYKKRALKDWRGWILPCALLIPAIVQLTIVAAYPGWSTWLSPLILTLSLLSTGILLIARLFVRSISTHLTRFVTLCGIGALVIGPLLWSSVSLTHPADGGSPIAGPRTPNVQSLFADPELFHSPGTYALNKNDQKLLHYLVAQRGTTMFLLATLNAAEATPFILISGQPVMALGGFNGSDPILTTTQLMRDVQGGIVRFFLLPVIVRISGSASHHSEKVAATGGNRKLVQWIITNCIVVPASTWETGHSVLTQTTTGTFLQTNSVTMATFLYHCG